MSNMIAKILVIAGLAAAIAWLADQWIRPQNAKMDQKGEVTWRP